MDSQIEIVVSNPQIVRRSRTAESAALYYRFYTETKIGDKWLCVVVKYADDDAFVVTAYFTDKLKAGEDLWPTK